MQNTEGTPDRDTLWKQYALHVDLYKFYLDLVVKVNVFYYAVTGAILTYYFQHSADGVARFALLLPIFFSLAIGAIFFYGARLIGVVRNELFAIRDRLDLETAPDLGVLRVFLWTFGSIMLLTGVGLVGFFLFVWTWSAREIAKLGKPTGHPFHAFNAECIGLESAREMSLILLLGSGGMEWQAKRN